MFFCLCLSKYFHYKIKEEVVFHETNKINWCVLGMSKLLGPCWEILCWSTRWKAKVVPCLDVGFPPISVTHSKNSMFCSEGCIKSSPGLGQVKQCNFLLKKGHGIGFMFAVGIFSQLFIELFPKILLWEVTALSPFPWTWVCCRALVQGTVPSSQMKDDI